MPIILLVFCLDFHEGVLPCQAILGNFKLVEIEFMVPAAVDTIYAPDSMLDVGDLSHFTAFVVVVKVAAVLAIVIVIIALAFVFWTSCSGPNHLSHTDGDSKCLC
jgi:hypothetical protein